MLVSGMWLTLFALIWFNSSPPLNYRSIFLCISFVFGCVTVVLVDFLPHLFSKSSSSFPSLPRSCSPQPSDPH